jgi:signal recognition particle GTPase
VFDTLGDLRILRMGDVLMLIEKAERRPGRSSTWTRRARSPVKLVGVGEGLDDLRPFDARDYANALLT